MTPILEEFSQKPSQAKGPNPPSDMACVIIGRNEGERLIDSLSSVQASGLPPVYVDSGSTDDSPATAHRLGVRTINLDSERPFSAARGRNEGLDEAMRLWPNTRYILFLDGDCTLDPDFPCVAAKILDDDPECAIVTGHLFEQYPDRSVYNRLCSIEWQSPAGRLDRLNALGGIMTLRVSAFQAVGGFNEQAIAGEEADLGVRLQQASHSIIKADAPMATHDARILTFRQWWIRAIRGGYAFAHRYAEHRRTGSNDGRREVFSALFWGLAVPVLTVVGFYPTRGLSVLLLGGYVVLWLRMFRNYSRKGLSRSDALLSARFGLYAKFAHVVGIWRFLTAGPRGPRIIEYK